MRSTEVMKPNLRTGSRLRSIDFDPPAGSARETPPMRKLVRRAVVIALAAGIAYAIWRARRPAPTPALPHHPLTIPPGVDPEGGPEVEGELSGIEAWVEADDGGACPASHPVKAKLASGIFHVPGGLSYERTRADRCYLDPDAATADGLRQAKR